MAQRAKKKKKSPPPPVDPRAFILTEAERLAQLPALNSLQTRTPQTPAPEVDASAGPPPSVAVPAPASTYIDRGLPIPERYGADRLVALPRDAHWLFVYWELSGGALDRLRFQHSAEVVDRARWVLVVRVLRDASEHLVDIDLGAGQWYVKVATDTHFEISLGFVDRRGQLVVVLRGGETATARAAVAPVLDEEWFITREDLEKLLQAGGVPLSLETAAAPAGPRVRSEEPRAIGFFSGRWPG